MKLKIFIVSSAISLLFGSATLADQKTSGLNFYSGMFDFSDNNKRSTLVGVEHQNENFIEIQFLEEYLLFWNDDNS